MNQVISVNAEDLTATVQAGVTRKQLNEELRGTGLFFPIAPGADASLGVLSAPRASGTTAFRSGPIRAHVLTLPLVTAAFRIIPTANRASTSSPAPPPPPIFFARAQI